MHYLRPGKHSDWPFPSPYDQLSQPTLPFCQFYMHWRGTVAEWFECSPLVLKVPGSKHSLWAVSFKTFSVHPAVNGYMTLFRGGEGEGSEGEEWCSTAVTPLQVQVDSFFPIRPLWAIYGLWEQPLPSPLHAFGDNLHRIISQLRALNKLPGALSKWVSPLSYQTKRSKVLPMWQFHNNSMYSCLQTTNLTHTDWHLKRGDKSHLARPQGLTNILKCIKRCAI